MNERDENVVLSLKRNVNRMTCQMCGEDGTLVVIKSTDGTRKFLILHCIECGADHRPIISLELLCLD